MYENDEIGPDGTQFNPSIEGGILQNYKKIAGQTLEDMVEGDYWRANRDLQHKAAHLFNKVSANEKDLMQTTKDLVTRRRLNREIQFTEDFRKRYMTHEYGNYDKYEKNSITTEYDEGKDETQEDKFYDKYLDFLKRLPTHEADRMKDKTKKGLDMLV